MNSTSDDERRRTGRGDGAGGGGSVCSNVSGVIIFILCCRDYCFRLELVYGRITCRLQRLRGREFIKRKVLLAVKSACVGTGKKALEELRLGHDSEVSVKSTWVP